MSINSGLFKKMRNIKEIVNKRYIILIVLVILIFSVITFKLFNIQIASYNKYQTMVKSYSEKIIEGSSSPRGRIYDRNGKILVDNVAVKTIYYQKNKKLTVKEEIDLAYQVSAMLDLPYDNLNVINLKEFWLINNSDKARKKITAQELSDYKKRKLSLDDLKKLKLERITDEDLSTYTDKDKKAAYLYYLMNKGYIYDEKIIKNKNVTDAEYAKISENISTLHGFNTKIDWERIYPYGNTFKTILGKVSDENQGIPLELKDYYLNKGYVLNDRVGISYLEYQYENILKGTKAKYRVLEDNSLELISEGHRGQDIMLSIDIDLQQAMESILSEEVMSAKNEPNTEFYNRSMAIVSDPNTGEIFGMAGKQVLNTEGTLQIYDYTPGILTSPVIMGSVVKGASMTVGYQQGVIDAGTQMLDECIYIKSTPKKCSWRSLGLLDDTTALEWSSNSYQFKIAMAVAHANYVPNEPLIIDPNAFDIYRKTYAEYGLGIKTGIDLPVESLGYKGTSRQSGYLLDFAMGQYDTYTAIQLAQYINTIATKGTRIKPHLLKAVYNPSVGHNLDNKAYSVEPEILNNVKLDARFYERIHLGFRKVMAGYLGNGYMGYAPNQAGKTGTAESFVDTDNDGTIDKESINATFAGFAPYDNPKMTIISISPDVSHPYGISSYQTIVNKRISSRITNKFFDIYQ